MSELNTLFVEACKQAAIACHPWIGQGDKEAADAAAVDAMRRVFNGGDIQGRIVIGEGERDEAPMLFIGEELGKGASGASQIDIAVDPLEGTTLCAQDKPGAICVAAYAPRGDMLHAPDVYMQKIAVRAGFQISAKSLDQSAVQVAQDLADQAGIEPSALRVCMLERARHQADIDALKALGVSLSLIGDGDVIGALRTTLPADNPAAVDLYLGTGGAPEGVLAAAGITQLGGLMFGKLVFDSADQIQRAQEMGLDDPAKIFSALELVGPNASLVATGVTSGEVLRGVQPAHKDKGGDNDRWNTHSMVISSGTITLI